MNDNESFSSSDFALVTALYYLGFPIEALDRQPDGRVNFVFHHTHELDTTVEGFWKKDLRVEPSSYFSATKEIKSRIYER